MRYRIAIAVWLGAFCGLLCIIGLIVGAPKLLTLSRGFQLTTGTVTAAIPNSHGAFVVRYEVNGKTYEEKLGPSSAQSGMRVTVYFSPSDPQLAALDDPKKLLIGQVPFAVGGSFLIATDRASSVREFKWCAYAD